MAVPQFHLHLVSDATGETLESIANAATAQFDRRSLHKHYWPMIRTSAHMKRVMADIERRPGLILYTLVDEDIRAELIRHCTAQGLRAVSVLDPVIGALAQYLGQEATHRPGRQHELDDRYFKRIEAMDFAMAHDDGHVSDHLSRAEIILIGVSRTSKTPTSIYLANRGYKVANVPFILGHDMPQVLDEPLSALVVGLTSSPQRLADIRGNRLLLLNQNMPTSYGDLDMIKDEVRACRRYCSQHRWPMIDVSRRSIEETASAIIKLYQERSEPNNGDN